jgi:hypothetical protein
MKKQENTGQNETMIIMITVEATTTASERTVPTKRGKIIHAKNNKTHHKCPKNANCVDDSIMKWISPSLVICC